MGVSARGAEDDKAENQLFKGSFSSVHPWSDFSFEAHTLIASVAAGVRGVLIGRGAGGEGGDDGGSGTFRLFL